MCLFDHQSHTEFNPDRVVVIHELGHAVTWFSYGEGVGRMKFTRGQDGLLCAKTLLEFRDLNSHASDQQAACYAVERMLGGESAARRAVGFRRDQICSDRIPITSDNDLRRLLRNRIYDNRKSDFFNVLRLTASCDPPDWHTWLQERLVNAQRAVDANWEPIVKIARKIVKRLPKNTRRNYYCWGTNLIASLQGAGVSTRLRPALEILEQGEIGGLWTNLKRFRRRFGKKRIVSRFMQTAP